MAQKEVIIDTTTPGSILFSIAAGITAGTYGLLKHLRILCTSLLLTSVYENGNGN